ncbi:farnesol dehydrogenase-like [Schistocerca gregaria]|uniref:farnesol dehydrogenase-like n=1 Tax=Schistocerca gregaria TaxID=7010 RepID=UPI00211E437F|nr:farnesol dehydrogenase-like [Schistocerca gregaria]
MQRYADRVALVTGASCGIGAAVTQELLRQGLTVVGLARRVDRVKELELPDAPGKLHAIQGDVTDEDSILAAFKWIKDNLSGVDVLVNNAGVIEESELTSAPTDLWRRVLEVNVLGLSICTREAVQDMLARGVDDGFIIHISSLAAHSPPYNSDLAMYYASKHAVNTLLEGLRKDLVARGSKIRVGAVSPGLVKTEIFSHSKKITPDIFNIAPCLEAEDVANAVVYMLSQHPRVQVHDIILNATGTQ